MPEVMDLPEKRFFVPYYPRVADVICICYLRVLSEACREGKLNVTYTSGRRGAVARSDRSVSAVPGDAT